MDSNASTTGPLFHIGPWHTVPYLQLPRDAKQPQSQGEAACRPPRWEYTLQPLCFIWYDIKAKAMRNLARVAKDPRLQNLAWLSIWSNTCSLSGMLKEAQADLEEVSHKPELSVRSFTDVPRIIGFIVGGDDFFYLACLQGRTEWIAETGLTDDCRVGIADGILNPQIQQLERVMSCRAQAPGPSPEGSNLIRLARYRFMLCMQHKG